MDGICEEGNVRLLLVEDDEDFRTALTLRLKKRNFNVEAVPSAEEALKRIEGRDVEIVVADIKLPGMDGISFLEKVREADQHLPVILLTGYASLESAKEALKLGAADYLLKPLEDMEDLLEPINKAIHGHRLYIENKGLYDRLSNKISELELSERKYRELFELASDIIYLVDTDNRIISVNNKLIDMTGYTRVELVGRMAESVVDFGEDFNFRAVVDGKIVGHMEVYVISRDGERHIGEMGMRPILEGGNVQGVQCLIHDITKRREMEKELEASAALLLTQKSVLEEKNIALKEILGQLEVEKKQIKEDVFTNVERILIPILERLRRKMPPMEVKYIDMVQCNLEELTSSFGRKITDRLLRLTPKEIEICNMVKAGLTSKEIANLMNISLQTAERHRNNIRKKFGIVNKHVNLATYLQML